MKPRHILMGVALAAAAVLVLFGDKSPNAGVAEAVDRKPARAQPATAPAAAPAAAARPGAAAILRLLPREELIGDAGEGSFKSRDGVFGGQSWNPPPPPPPSAAELKPAPPPPPTAPPLPFQFLGKAAADGKWEVYLGRGEQTFVVQKGSQIDGMYRVDAIAPPTLTMTYLPMNQVQQLNIGVIE
ncbi:hypothetical protein [Pseudoduganella violaceinigra]|uniref:hypothetical protein n=1 Tax=Pseudoduganella violaceinigra TaxID=246602 RepID=UPI0004028F55|nr:hypothetical protein [Pseudoduganella violaceinigra]